MLKDKNEDQMNLIKEKMDLESAIHRFEEQTQNHKLEINKHEN